MTYILQTTFPTAFWGIFNSDINFIEVCSQVSNSQYVSIGSGDD